MTLRRAAELQVHQGVVGQYIHNVVAPGLGKIGVDRRAGVGRARPPSSPPSAARSPCTSPPRTRWRSTRSGLDPAVVAREKAVLADKNAGKPAHVLEKIVESGLKTYYKEVCLLDQAFVHGSRPRRSAQAVKESEGKVGGAIALKGFVRYALGEGIEKQESDFAAEVPRPPAGGLIRSLLRNGGAWRRRFHGGPFDRGALR